jgi:hypothetical protein
VQAPVEGRLPTLLADPPPLQPVSVEGIKGINIAAGIGVLTLRAAK